MSFPLGKGQGDRPHVFGVDHIKVVLTVYGDPPRPFKLPFSAAFPAPFSANFSIDVENLQQRIQEISLVALRLYLQQPALTTLHGVTACQALADISQRAAAYPATVEDWVDGVYLRATYDDNSEGTHIKHITFWKDMPWAGGYKSGAYYPDYPL